MKRTRRRSAFPVLLLLLPLFSAPGLPAGGDSSPDPALFRVSRIRDRIRPRLTEFGEVLEIDPDSALIRTTRVRAELLSEAGAEITRVMDPPAVAPPPIFFRPPRKSGVEEPVIREIIGQVDRDEIYQTMAGLTGAHPVTIGGVERRILTRNSYQTEGIAWATQYGYERLENLGLAVEFHNYTWNGNSWRNVVAEQPGSVSPDLIYIICGHIDSLPAGPVSPGADDNASGTTAVLTAAEILSGYSFEHTVRYVLFTGEEQGLIGSRYYVQDALAAGDAIAGALNFDMIAYDSTGDGEMYVYSGTTESSRLLGDIFVDTVETYGLGLAPVRFNTEPDWSDQYRFWEAGYPAMVAIESFDDFNPNYHQVEDTLDNCNLDYLTEIVKAGVGALARLASPVSLPVSAGRADFNGDGTAEVAIYRPSSGLWAAREVTRVYFGRSGDRPVPGDYRGDGTDLPAVFRPSSGLWAVRGLSRFYFGRSGDHPVPGDYRGDGTARPAVFRPDSGLWAVRGWTRIYFGREGDQPVSGNYTGDGTTQPAVFRPGSGLWAVRGLTRLVFGRSGDQPVPGDYRGDGTDFPSVFRPSSGVWAVRGWTRFYFGTVGDFPLSADYGGTGTRNPGIFRSATGLWALRDLTRTYFGTRGDLPVSR